MHKPKWNEKKWDPKIMAWVADDGDGIPIYKLIGNCFATREQAEKDMGKIIKKFNSIKSIQESEE